MVYALCLRYARDQPEAQDLAQEVWMQVFDKLSRFRDTGSFEGWVRRIAVNTSISFLRKRRDRNLDTAAQVVQQGFRVEPQAIDHLSTRELLDTIASLPEGYRLVFNLVAIEGYTHDEVASLLGITASASRSQLTRARASLQARLAQMKTLCL